MSTTRLLQLAACPEDAERWFSEFLKARTSASLTNADDFPEAFLKIFGNSRYLAQQLCRTPASYEAWLGDSYRDTEKPLSVFEDEIRAVASVKGDTPALLAALKAYKYREYLRLTIRELNLQNQEEIYREFSHLAHAIAAPVAERILAEQCQKHDCETTAAGGFAIIAMGKLGGRELNYSSDIDLVGVYGEDGDAGMIDRHELFCRVFAAFGKTLQNADEHGFLYRVDWDLRPEGKTGTLANTLDAMESYYETFGEEWERQAYIKADTLFDHAAVSRRFLEMMTPFTYRKYMDAKTLQRIRDMKANIIGELKMKRQDGINIKLGNGGIRDVEFIAQGLQLLHGGKIQELRTPHTLTALKNLSRHAILPTEDANALRDGYLFLRRLESALQMDEERQTHVLKDDPTEHLKAARRLGFVQDEEEALARFEEQFNATRDAVQNLFRKYCG